MFISEYRDAAFMSTTHNFLPTKLLTVQKDKPSVHLRIQLATYELHLRTVKSVYPLSVELPDIVIVDSRMGPTTWGCLQGTWLQHTGSCDLDPIVQHGGPVMLKVNTVESIQTTSIFDIQPSIACKMYS